jgi:hypothetical protein
MYHAKQLLFYSKIITFHTSTKPSLVQTQALWRETTLVIKMLLSKWSPWLSYLWSTIQPLETNLPVFLSLLEVLPRSSTQSSTKVPRRLQEILVTSLILVRNPITILQQGCRWNPNTHKGSSFLTSQFGHGPWWAPQGPRVGKGSLSTCTAETFL